MRSAFNIGAHLSRRSERALRSPAASAAWYERCSKDTVGGGVGRGRAPDSLQSGAMPSSWCANLNLGALRQETRRREARRRKARRREARDSNEAKRGETKRGETKRGETKRGETKRGERRHSAHKPAVASSPRSQLARHSARNLGGCNKTSAIHSELWAPVGAVRWTQSAQDLHPCHVQS